MQWLASTKISISEGGKTTHLLFMLFGLIPPTPLNYVALKSFDIERT